MDTARYFVALLLLLSVPPAVGLWYFIHPFARTWRRIGPLATYLVLTPPAAGVAWTAYLWRDRLLGADLGTRPALMALAVVAFIVGIPIAVRRRRELKERVLVGVPEMSRTDKGHLVIEGVYARTRNPRYLEFIVFVLAYVAFANYTGTWVMYVLTFPALHLVVLLEERELRDRFGAEYEEYCRRVPRYLPRRTGARARG